MPGHHNRPRGGTPSYTVHLEDVRFLHRTDLAAKILYDGEEYWFPFTQMPPEEVAKLCKMGRNDPELFTLTVSEWIAIQKGIIDAD